MAQHVTRRMILLSGVGAAMLLSRTAMSAWPMVTVHKDPNCGCCGGWIAHLETHGFQVKVIETTELNRVRARLGVPFARLKDTCPQRHWKNSCEKNLSHSDLPCRVCQAARRV
jgi:hypothetical protein